MSNRKTESQLDLSVQNRIDGLCDQFERAWRAGARPRFDDFLARADCDPKNAPTELAETVKQLLAIELAYRRRLGEAPLVEEYCRRMPGIRFAVEIAFQKLRSASADDPTASSRAPERNAQIEAGGTDQTDVDDRPERSRVSPRDFDADSDTCEEGPGVRDHDSASVDTNETTAPFTGETIGLTIGPYKIVRLIGEGGMGDVYLAQQAQPVRRLVALKLIKAGMDSKQVIARFEAERQALALMDHPHIAKVFDGGTTRHGRPYFIMEYVKGVPITRYCEENRLGLPQRLELFIDVCHAVQHAHQKGIIHRDLKPSNVLVALADDRPLVKVIDFGVAKAAGQPLTDKTLATELGAIVGTLEYMSPEQAGLNNQDIDTRSDVYSLGVMLYQLLTGTTPHHRRRDHAIPFTEMLRVIREDDPPKPSTRVGESKETLSALASECQTEPSRLAKSLRGELDWIVMKALEKDRVRRYETANGLAFDVRRYLADEQVQACPPSAGYRLRKFVRRNRMVMTSAALLVTVLLLGTVVSAFFAVRANRFAKEANEQREQARQDLRLLAEANSFIHEGRIHANNGRWQQSLAAMSKAIDLRPDNSAAWFERGDFFTRVGLWDRAAADYAQAFQLQKPTNPSGWYLHAVLQAYTENWDEYQRVCGNVSRYASAESHPGYENQLARVFGLGSAPNADLNWAWHWAETGQHRLGPTPWNYYAMGVVCYRMGDFPRAIGLLREAHLRIGDWRGGGANAAVLAMTHFRLGNGEEARRLLEMADKYVESYMQTVFSSKDFVPKSAANWAEWLEMLVLHREAKKLIDGQAPAADPRMGWIRSRGLAAIGELKPDDEVSRLNQGIELMSHGKLDDAATFFKAAISANPNFWPAYVQLGITLRRPATMNDAIIYLQKAVDLEPNDYRPHHELALAYYGINQHREALASAKRAEALQTEDAVVYSTLASVETKLGMMAEAYRHYSRGIELQPNNGSITAMRGGILMRAGLWDRALADYLRAFEQTSFPSPWVWHERAAFQAYLQDWEGYRETLRVLPTQANAEHVAYIGYENSIARAFGLANAPGSDLAWAKGRATLGVERQGPTPWNQYALGVVYFRSGEYDQALQLLQAAHARRHEWHGSASTAAVLAMTLQQLDRHREARELLDETGAQIDALVRSALVARDITASGVPSIAEWLEAHILYREARQLIDHQFPEDDPRMALIRAKGLALLGERDESLRLCLAVRSQWSLDPFAAQGAFVLLTELGEAAEADQAYNELCRQHPLCFHHDISAIAYLTLTAQLEKARGEYQRFSRSRSPGDEMHLVVGNLYFRERIWPDSRMAFERGLGRPLDSRDARVKELLARAIQGYRQGNLCRRDQALAENALGVGLQLLEADPEAEVAFRRAIAVRSEWEYPHMMLGKLMRRQGRVADALASFQRAVELRPNSTEALASLSWLLATASDSALRNPDLAVQYARTATQVEPQSAVAWKALGVSWYRKSDWSAAVEALRRSMEYQRGGDSDTWLFLAMAHWQLGQADEARKWLAQAVTKLQKNQLRDEELLRFRTEAEELIK